MNNQARPGTPATLNQAIANGLYDARYSGQTHLEMVEAHVRDFLAQKFGAAFLGTASPTTEAALILLWTKVTAAPVIEEKKAA